MNAYITAVGLVASIAILAMAVPQLVKIVRDRTTVGVSLGAWGMYTLLSAMWCGYAVSFGSRLQLVQTALCIVLGIGLNLTIVTQRRHGLPGAIGWIFASTAVGVTAASAPQAAVTWGAVAVAVAAELPQPVASWRSLRAHAVTDVSIPTWAIGIVASGAWAVYGGLEGYSALLAASAFGVVAKTFTVTVETYLRRRRRRPAPVGAAPGQSGAQSTAHFTFRNGTAP